MTAAFSWLPVPLALLVSAVFSVFLLIILFQAIKVIVELLRFLMDIFGGLIAKVVGYFV